MYVPCEEYVLSIIYSAKKSCSLRLRSFVCLLGDYRQVSKKYEIFVAINEENETGRTQFSILRQNQLLQDHTA
jgi:hypothetical protein